MTDVLKKANSNGYSKHLGFAPLIAIGAAAYCGLLLVHIRSGTLTHQSVPISISLYVLAFVAYVGAIFWTEYRRGIPAIYLWGGAVAFRLLLLMTEPTLSTDVYRYLWDGFVANNGISPYAFPIESIELDHLDVPIRALANHTWMASPYLPAAQMLFSAVTAFMPLDPFYMQVSMAALDLFNGGLIMGLLGFAGLPRYRAMIYLWSPLTIVETAHGAHVDAWMISLSLAALFLVLRQPRTRLESAAGIWLAPILLALATLTKLLPVLLLPVLFWRWRWRSLLVYSAVLFFLLMPPGLQAGWGLEEPLDGDGLFGALRIYGDRWNFNSGLFHWVERGLANPALSSLPVETANRYAKRLMGGGLLFVLAVVCWLARSKSSARSQLRLMTVPIVAYTLLTTTVHPWYLLMLLALLPFLTPAPDEPQAFWLLVAPWIYLSGAIFTSYYTYVDPRDLREYPWVRQIEWLPTLVLLLFAVAIIIAYDKSSRAASRWARNR